MSPVRDQYLQYTHIKNIEDDVIYIFSPGEVVRFKWMEWMRSIDRESTSLSCSHANLSCHACKQNVIGDVREGETGFICLLICADIKWLLWLLWLLNGNNENLMVMTAFICFNITAKCVCHSALTLFIPGKSHDKICIREKKNIIAH